MLCKKCSQQIPDNSVYCCWCGVHQATPNRKRGVKRRGNGQGSVYKRGRHWQAEIIVGWGADGRRIRRYKGGFDTKREALEYIPLLKAEKPKSAKTLKYYYDSYSSAEMLKLGKTTQGAYRIAWRRLSDLHNAPVKNLSVITLRDIVSEVAPTFDTASDVKSLLSHLFKLAIADQEASVNLSEFIPLPAKNESEQTPWSKDEQQTIWKAYADGDVIASYLLLMIYTGMMPGELRKCTRSMIDFENHIIVGAGLKTKKRRSTPIVLADIIIPVLQTILTYTSNEDEQNQSIMCMDKTTFYDAYHIFTNKYKLRDLPVYSCRHTTATALALADVPVSIIQKVMRHSKLTTTQHYIHPDTKDALIAVNIVGNKVGNKTEFDGIS